MSPSLARRTPCPSMPGVHATLTARNASCRMIDVNAESASSVVKVLQSSSVQNASGLPAQPPAGQNRGGGVIAGGGLIASGATRPASPSAINAASDASAPGALSSPQLVAATPVASITVDTTNRSPSLRMTNLLRLITQNAQRAVIFRGVSGGAADQPGDGLVLGPVRGTPGPAAREQRRMSAPARDLEHHVFGGGLAPALQLARRQEGIVCAVHAE